MSRASELRGLAYQHVNACLQKHGFSLLRPCTEWEHVQHFSVHEENGTRLNFNMKDKLWIEKSFIDNHILIAVFHDGRLFVYDHDKLVEYIRKERIDRILTSKSWRNIGEYYYNAKYQMPQWAIEYIDETGCPIKGKG